MLFVAAILFGISVVALACRITTEAGHQTNRVYTDQDGNIHLNGSALYINESGQTLPAGPGEVVAATNVITAAENGATFFLSSATEFVSTLPAPALGLRYTFIVAAAPSGASYTIVTDGSANVIVGHVLTSQDAGGTADSETTGGDTITFVDGKAVVGDRVDVVSDGTNWYARASCKVFDGITITTAS